MNFIVRFFVFLCILLSMGHGHLKAIGHQHDISRTSIKASQDAPRTDHCIVKSLVVTTSPSRKDKEHNEIEIPGNENREEDESDDDDKRTSLSKSDYFTSFFYSQAPVYFAGCNPQYFSFVKNASYSTSSRCIVFHVFRI